MKAEILSSFWQYYARHRVAVWSRTRAKNTRRAPGNDERKLKVQFSHSADITSLRIPDVLECLRGLNMQ